MSCNSCSSSTNPCGCLNEYPSSCIRYDGDEFTCSTINVEGKNISELFKNIDDYFCTFKTELDGYLSIVNTGNGAKIYTGDDLQGQKQLKTFVSSDSSIFISENTEEIDLVAVGATDSERGIIQLATQAEADSGTNALKAITPLTMGSYVNTFITNPVNLPSASETSEGVVERATASEVVSLTDSIRYVTPLGLSNLFASQIEVNNLTVTDKIVSPGTLPIATDVQLGLMEFATQSESDGLLASDKAISPSTLPIATQTQIGIGQLATQLESNALSDLTKLLTPGTLPVATETQQGIVELADISETNTLSITDKAVSPGNLPLSTETQQGLSAIATQAETDGGINDTKFITPLKLETKLASTFPTVPIIAESFETTISSWNSYDSFNFSHGLSGIPKIVQVMLVAKANGNGYSVGEEILMGTHHNVRPDTPQWYGVRCSTTSTQINLRIGLNINLPIDPDASRSLINDSNDSGGFSIKIKAFF